VAAGRSVRVTRRVGVSGKGGVIGENGGEPCRKKKPTDTDKVVTEEDADQSPTDV